MENKNFLNRMYGILGTSGRKYNIMPNLLQQTFDKMIEKRVSKDIDEEGNPGEPTIFVDKDEVGNLFLNYINEEGVSLQILDGEIEYEGLKKGINVRVSSFLYEFERVIKEEQNRITENIKAKNDELFAKVQAGELDIKEYGEAIQKLGQQLTEIKEPIEYLDKMLEHYNQNLHGNKVYDIDCKVAEGEGSERGPRKNKSPIRNIKEEFNLKNRIKGIESIVLDADLIKVNGGEYYGYIYDLENNKNNENGFMIILEPEKNESAATRVIYMSEEEFDKLKKEHKEKDDIEIKAMYLKEILEDREKVDQTSKVCHRDYGKWLAIIDFYLKGSKQINPEILEKISDEKFKERYPREYLTKGRKELLEPKKDTNEDMEK